MSQAEYTRQQSNGGSVLYKISPARLAGDPATLFVTIPVLSGFLSFFASCTILAIGAGTGSVTEKLAGPFFLLMWVVTFGAMCFLSVRFHYKRLPRKIGKRNRVQLTIDRDYLSIRDEGKVDSGSQQTSIPRASVRRVRLGNTFHRGVEPSGDSDVVVVVPPITAFTASLRRGLEAKRQALCYFVGVDHGNEIAVLADGLDELTARNLYDDVGKDLGMNP